MFKKYAKGAETPRFRRGTEPPVVGVGVEVVGKDGVAFHLCRECSTPPLWISAKDRLPEESCEVLIGNLTEDRERFCSVTNMSFSAKYQAFNVWDFMSADEAARFAVTVDYWQPMPVLPGK